MARIRKAGQLAAVGSTGNNTHTSVSTPADADSLSLEFEITAVGATPTVTYKYQGSQDDGTTPDASSDWFDLPVVVDPVAGAEAVPTTALQVQTAVGVYEAFVQLAQHPITKVRLVTSANTNVTYESECWASVDV